jgi:hypothetical protein
MYEGEYLMQVAAEINDRIVYSNIVRFALPLRIRH